MEFFDPNTPLPRLRGDLVISRQEYRGMLSYVIKDPVSLRYYRVGREDIYLAGLLDGTHTLREVVELVKREFPGEDHSESSVLQILKTLAQMSFLQLEGRIASNFYRILVDRKRQNKTQKAVHSFLSSIFYFKVPLYDPDLVLLNLEKRLRFMWSRTTLIVLGVLLVTAGYLALSNQQQLGSRLPEFLTLHNAFLLWITLMLVKVVHEFGHGLTCKHFGGEVHEMGTIFVVLSPFLYCDATDAWMFRKKWQKMAVNLGGIYFELFLAGISTLIWAATELGTVNQLALNVMVVCSISTVVFNANPLLRFDGYYALADFVEIPNLRDRARKYMAEKIVSLFTRIPYEDDEVAGSWSQALGLSAFAVASYFYTWFIAYRIILIVGYKLEPFGLARFGQALEVAFYVLTLFVPMYGFAKVLKIRMKENNQKYHGLVRGALVACGVVFLVCLLPWPLKVENNCVIGGSNRSLVRAASDGFIRQVLVREGEFVSKDQPLAILENFPLENRLKDISIRLESNKILMAGALARNDPSEIRVLTAQAAGLQSTRDRLEIQVRSLTLKSPIEGKVLTAKLELDAGTYIQEGSVFCEILQKSEVQMVVALNQREAGMVKTGQNVDVKIYSMPSKVFGGKVLKTSVASSEQVPHLAFSSRFGGDVPTLTDVQGREHPSDVLYLADILINNTDQYLRPGMSGRAKIHCGTSNPVRILLSRATELLRLDLQF